MSEKCFVLRWLIIDFFLGGEGAQQLVARDLATCGRHRDRETDPDWSW